MELLKQLYSIHSPSGEEKKMRKFLKDWVKRNVPEATYTVDAIGNLYVCKGDSKTYPCIVSHIDQVQKTHSKDFQAVETQDIIFGFSLKNVQLEGLGADDKNGIFVCLRCLEECPCLKVFMAVGEEKGCIGSNRADMSFFSDSLYVLEPDCKGGTEIHTCLRGIPCASTEFEQALQADANGYTITDGKTSDILALTLNGIGVSCANIPAGYYLPHKDDEYTVISELNHTLSYVRYLIQNLDRRYPHEYKSETQLWVEKKYKFPNMKNLLFYSCFF